MEPGHRADKEQAKPDAGDKETDQVLEDCSLTYTLVDPTYRPTVSDQELLGEVLPVRRSTPDDLFDEAWKFS